MIYLFLILLSFIVYGPALYSPIRFHDDVKSIIVMESSYKQALSMGWKDRFRFWWLHQRPVYEALNCLNYQWAAWFFAARWHVVNAGLHGASSCLALLAFQRIGWEPAIWMTVAFVVHPIQTASVCYVTGRSSILAALFLFAAVNAYLWPFPWCLISVCPVVMGYLSREDSIVVLAWLPLLEVYR